MCDTMLIKRDGKMFFGKNSDRSPNEAHLMLRVPAKDYKQGEMLRTTYIQIPQAQHTYSCVLLKPHWIWGAEMGWNEYGLNIGNEAVFTKVKRESSNGLIGMDLLRLALERCRTAQEATDLIVSLIKTYGQGGNCGFDKKFYYDNAFLIADGKDAFILESAGRNTAVKKADDITAISNCLSIRKDYSGNEQSKTDFKRKYQNNLFTKVAGAERRKETSLKILSQNGTPVGLLLMQALRSHADTNVTPCTASTSSVCMHAGNMFGDHTTGSYCGEINKVYFVTGSSMPCLSIYKPLSVRASVLPTDEHQALKYWVQRELINRHLMSGNIDKDDYLRRASALQRQFTDMAAQCKTQQELENVSEQCFLTEQQFVDDLLKSVRFLPLKIKGNFYFTRYWAKKNEKFKALYHTEML